MYGAKCMASECLVGVDVGGTKIAMALVSPEGEMMAEYIIPTRPDEGVTGVLDRIADGISQLINDTEGEILGIGIGCPGLVNFETSTSIYAVNMGQDWRDIDVRSEIGRRIAPHIPIWIENDVRAGAIGERYFGAAKDHDDFVFVTVGTGLGGSAFVEGRLLRGAGFTAMEIGHAQAIENGRKGDLGLLGAPEVYVSGKGFMMGWVLYRDQFSQSNLAHQVDVTTTDIIMAAHQADPLALKIIEDAAQALGTALAWCVTVLNPSLVVVGGGLGQACGVLLLEPTREVVRRRVLPINFEVLQFKLAEAKSSALGPAALVLYATANQSG